MYEVQRARFISFCKHTLFFMRHIQFMPFYIMHVRYKRSLLSPHKVLAEMEYLGVEKKMQCCF